MELRILEFYSGIGGMRYAFEKFFESQSQFKSYTFIEAFDINTQANIIYKHNFSHEPCRTNIEHLTSTKLDQYNANVWLLSPPCQPYTRIGKQKDLNDARAKSFLHLMDILPKMKNPPSFLLVENVKNFEISKTNERFLKILKELNYNVEQYLVNTTQIGLVNERLRFYLLASRSTTSHSVIGPILTEFPCNPKRREETLSNYICKVFDKMEELYISIETLEKRKGYRFDICTPFSNTCSCFTKGYFNPNFMRGTGPILATKNWDQLGKVDWYDASTMSDLQLRWFAPEEIAALMGFPIGKKTTNNSHGFEFPNGITLKQKYSVLGNSLNVTVVSILLERLFQI